MEFSISENASVGDIVTSLVASDEDDGHSPIFSPSMYSTLTLVQLVISVNTTLDYETEQSVDFTVYATDLVIKTFRH